MESAEVDIRGPRKAYLFEKFYGSVQVYLPS